VKKTQQKRLHLLYRSFKGKGPVRREKEGMEKRPIRFKGRAALSNREKGEGRLET